MKSPDLISFPDLDTVVSACLKTSKMRPPRDAEAKAQIQRRWNQALRQIGAESSAIAATSPAQDAGSARAGDTGPPGTPSAFPMFVAESTLPGSVEVDARALGAEFIRDSIVVDMSICNFEGVDLGSVFVRSAGLLSEVESHPAFIEEVRQSMPPPTPNRSKVHLVDCEAPIIDQGNLLTLDLARSDYWTTEATNRSIDRIQAQVASGDIDLMLLPRRLDVHLVVVCAADNALLLARRGKNLSTEPATWMITVGESMDWDRDQRGGLPHPVSTARHCLTERDELNLPRSYADGADLRLVAIATEWKYMLANLIVLARVPGLTFDEAATHFRKGENIALDAVEFTPASCAAILESRYFEGSAGGPRSRSPQLVSDISRVALDAALRNAYPDAGEKPVTS